MDKQFYVYLLVSTTGATYVGATVDVAHRLRQHNKEIVGGARATGARVAKGERWRRACYVANFPTWQAALQFEWRWKQISRTLGTKQSPIMRRITALNRLLSMEKSTSSAEPFSEWDNPPVPIFEEADAHACYTATYPAEIQF